MRFLNDPCPRTLVMITVSLYFTSLNFKPFPSLLFFVFNLNKNKRTNIFKIPLFKIGLNFLIIATSGYFCCLNWLNGRR
jgi:hypothetical protein